MFDKKRDRAAQQENSAANLANLDFDDAPLSGSSDVEVDGHDDNATSPTGPKSVSDCVSRPVD